MNKEQYNERFEEIVNCIKAMNKKKYYKAEVLPELFELQNEIVKLTFAKTNVDTYGLKIWDAEELLKKRNEEVGNVAQAELECFIKGSKELSILIRGESGGCCGEQCVYKALEKMENDYRILKNIEIKEDIAHSEMDAIAITSGGVVIVEVKKTDRNTNIDEDGNMYKYSENNTVWCGNLYERMTVKEGLVKSILLKAGFGEVPISSIVVFSNYKIEVHNRCNNLNTCFITQLPYFIDKQNKNINMTSLDIDKLADTITAADCKEEYAINFDALAYKQNFANLLIKLEEAEQVKCLNRGEKLRSEKINKCALCLLFPPAIPFVLLKRGK